MVFWSEVECRSKGLLKVGLYQSVPKSRMIVYRLVEVVRIGFFCTLSLADNEQTSGADMSPAFICTLISQRDRARSLEARIDVVGSARDC